MIGTVAKRALAAATGATRSNGASVSRGHKQKVSEKTKQMREICCEEQCGMRGRCDRKLGGPLEKDKETKRDVVYAIPGGRCCHVFEDCRALLHASVQLRDRCRFCARKTAEEAARKLERGSGSSDEAEWHARDRRRNRSETAAKIHEQEILRQFESS